MAHILLIIDSPTAINTNFMSHYEELLYKIDSKKYLIKGKNRIGYNRANTSELHYHNMRYKEEIIPYVLRDCNAIILNPKTNKITLWQILTDKPHPGDNIKISVGKSFMIIRWLFKWFNILRLNKIIGLEPVDAANMDDKNIPYDNLSMCWNYVYAFGYLKDIRNKYGEEML